MPRTQPSGNSLAAKWDRSRELIKLNPSSEDDPPEWNHVFDLESDVLRGPIHSLEDVVAKLRAIALAFDEGERTDGADASALRQAIDWLETNLAPPVMALPRSG
jgi:hypothetical protein